MDDNDEIIDQLYVIEHRIDTLDKTFIECTSDMLEALKLQADMIAQIGEVMALIQSPNQNDLERFQTLREAFDRYDFVRQLTLGQKSGDKK